jgi:hypothetical protein
MGMAWSLRYASRIIVPVGVVGLLIVACRRCHQHRSTHGPPPRAVAQGAGGRWCLVGIVVVVVVVIVGIIIVVLVLVPFPRCRRCCSTSLLSSYPSPSSHILPLTPPLSFPPLLVCCGYRRELAPAIHPMSRGSQAWGGCSGGFRFRGVRVTWHTKGVGGCLRGLVGAVGHSLCNSLEPRKERKQISKKRRKELKKKNLPRAQTTQPCFVQSAPVSSSGGGGDGG